MRNTSWLTNKARTPILAIILSLLAMGYTFAANRVVVVPMLGSDSAQWALVRGDGKVIAGSSGVSSIKRSTGIYIVDFGKDVIGHAVIVSSKDINRSIAASICGALNGARGETITCSSQHNTTRKVLITAYANINGLPNDTEFYVAVLP